MIVINGDTDRQKEDVFHGSTIRLPERVARRTRSLSPPLPDYEASEAQYRKALLYYQKPWHQSRLWRAILFGLLTYALLTTVIGVPIIVSKMKKKDESNWDSTPWAINDPNMPGNNEQLSSNGSITLGDTMSCNISNTTAYDDSPDSPLPYSSVFQAKILSVGMISIRSNATFEVMDATRINGTLSVEYDPSMTGMNAVFYVYLRTTTLALQDRTLICFSDDGPNRGLSIFVPDQMTPKDFIQLDIRFVIPKAGPTTLVDSDFYTYLPMFSQSFQNLSDFTFNTVSIEGTSRPINVTDLRASRISIKNMLADIHGTFNSSQALALDTIKGAINTSIILTKPPSRSNPTTLSLDTGDNEINAQITLLAPSAQPSDSSLHFIGKVNTFNGPIALNVSHHQTTPPVPIYFSVQNNMAPSKVALDQKYQGMFIAQTKLNNVSVVQGTEDPSYDPTDAKKPRKMEFDGQKYSSRLCGWIGWGKRPSPNSLQGHVEVISSISPVNITFGPI